MSGGAFDYKQWHIQEIADEIEQRILSAGLRMPKEELIREGYGYSPNFDLDHAEEYHRDFESKTIEIMERAVYVLRMAYIYTQRVDWMLSGDDGEDDLVKRLEEELKELKGKYPNGKFSYRKRHVKYDDDFGGWRDTSKDDEKGNG